MTDQVVQAEQLAPDLFGLCKGGQVIIYAPLRGKVFPATQEGLIQLRQFQHDGKSDEVRAFLAANGLDGSVVIPVADHKRPYQVGTLTLSLTSACNLRCIYCYAQGGFNPKNMKWEIAKESIDVFMTMLAGRGKKSGGILFHGGGEPTVSWKMLQKSVIYAEALATTLAINLKFSLVTNGTLITDEKAEWMVKHGFKVNVSLDGTQEVQDAQRPTAQGRGSFELVMAGIGNLGRHKVPFGFRSTITGQSVNDMIGLVRLAGEVGAGYVAFEPFTPSGRGIDGIESVDPTQYTRLLLEAVEIGKALGVKVKSSALRHDMINPEFCGACANIMCVLPSGNITSCTRVTRPEDELFEMFRIGSVGGQGGGILIDETQIDSLRSMTVQDIPQCQTCPAKWSCAGGCHQARHLAGGNQSEAYCSIVLATLWHNLAQNAGMAAN